MSIQGSRVGIVGGSIAGCAAAIALSRLGCEVHVYERSSGELRDRGSGIIIPLALRDELIAAGYLRADYPACVTARRWWAVANGKNDGQVLWRQASPAAMSNWGIMWRSLRAQVPDSSYHDCVTVADVVGAEDSATIKFDDGSSEEFDLVIGADGYRSTIRQLVADDPNPVFAGYILWRGNFPEKNLTDRSAIDALDAEHAWLTVGFDGGHAVMYPIPEFDDGTIPGRRRINWAIYTPMPEGLTITKPSSIPPGSVTPELYEQLRARLEAHFPPSMRPLFDSPRNETSIQPIYDQSIDRYVSGRVAVIGDAGTLARPHTGSGSTKAIQDARCLELFGARFTEWTPLLAAYEADRVDAGRTLVELGQRIGRDQVEHTPPWSTMSPTDFELWTAATLSGASLYFWGSGEAERA